MGTKRKALLASAVSGIWALVLAAGLLGSLVDGSVVRVGAAQGTTEIAISVDGVSPVGDSYYVPPGGGQSFSVLSIVNGEVTGLLTTEEAQWSLAAEDNATLSMNPGDFVVTVTPLAEGEAELQVTTGDGLSDSVTLLLGGGAKSASAFEIATPSDGATIIVPEGAGGVPLTVAGSSTAPDGLWVDYSWADGAASAAAAPYAVTIPDIAALGVPGVSAAAMAKSGLEVNDSAGWNVLAGEGTPGGFPADPFGLALTPGDLWLATAEVDGVQRTVALADVTEGALIALQDPADPAQVLQVQAPDGLVDEGDAALLVVAVSDDPAALLGPDAAIATGDPIVGGQYVFIDVLVLPAGTATYGSIDPARLAANPIAVTMWGVDVLLEDNARFLTLEAGLASGSEGLEVVQTAGALWTGTGGADVGVGKMAANVTGTGVFAPFVTAATINITTIANTGGTFGGQAKGYAVGGDTVNITVSNLSGLSVSQGDLAVTFGTEAATVTGLAGDIITVTAPRASALAAPAATASVDVTVEVTTISGETDTASNGFTYAGPAVTTVTPASGPQTGGTSVTVTGEGFDTTGTSVSLDGAPLTVSGTAATSISGTTTAREIGTVDVLVQTGNNYTGTGTDLFTYTPTAPSITSVIPNKALNDGGYMVRLQGSFPAPDADFAGSQTITGYFTTPTTAAAQTYVWDDQNIDVETPVHAAGASGVYVEATVDSAKAQLAQVNSNTASFTFLDSASATMSITDVDPGSGTILGGTTVTITGTNLPVSLGDITSGYVIRLGTAAASSGGTVDVPITLYRGDDAISAGEAASSLQFEIVFDDSVITYSSVTESTQLDTLYDKALQGNSLAANRVRVLVVGLNTNEITSYDGTTLIRPFPLGTLTFNVVGASGSTYLEMENIVAADGAASPLTLAAGQNGYFEVGSSANPPDPPDVYFGINPATVVGPTTATSITVTAPEGERPGAVDVRVVDPDDSNNFAVSKGSAAKANAGYTYTLSGEAVIESITPKKAWMFGGTVAVITGQGFDSTTDVFFGSVEAERAPAAAGTSTATTLYVIVPPVASTIAGASTDVEVTVDNPAKAGTGATFTYYRYDTSTEVAPGTSGNVTTTSFTYNVSAKPLDTMAIELPGTENGTLALPAIDFGGSTDVNVLVRATTVPALFGTDVISAGTAFADIWNFDIHLYDAAYPFDELTVGFNTTSAATKAATLNTGASEVLLTFPTTNVTEADIEGGEVSMYSVDSDLDYSIFDAPLYASDPESELYQSQVAAGEYQDVSGTLFVTSRLTHLSAFALRKAAAPLSLTGITPATGGLSGGTAVTITGQGLAWPTSVMFGSNAATSVTGVDEYSLTCVTPAGTAAGAVDVTVQTAAGSQTLTGAFTYEEDIAFTISPAEGTVNGGTTVTFTGTGLASPTSVLFGSTAATSITPISATQFTAVSPAGAEGTVDVTVTAAGGTDTLTSAFTYTDIGVDVTGLTPAFGPVSGGTTVTISGTGLDLITSVTFDGAAGTIATTGSTQIQVLSPAAPSGEPGRVDVVLTATVGGTAYALPALDFYYTSDGGPVPLVPIPNEGDWVVSGGDNPGFNRGYFTITLPAGFGNIFSVRVGGFLATWVPAKDGTILVTVPAGLDAGLYDVVVTSTTGTVGEGKVLVGDKDVTEPTLLDMTIGPDDQGAGADPAEAWLIGGVVATVWGTNLTNDLDMSFRYTASIDGVLVNKTLPLDVVVRADSSSAKIYVEVPALPGFGDEADAEILVNLRAEPVVKGMVSASELTGAFKYIRYAEDAAGVLTTAFYFDARGGADERVIVVNSAAMASKLDLSVAKINTDSVQADLTIPAYMSGTPAPDVNTDELETSPLTVSQNVYVVARASRDETDFGATDFSALPGDVVGDGIGETPAWTFDIHLYQVPAGVKLSADDRLYEEIGDDDLEAYFTTTEVKAQLALPMTDAGVTVSRIEEGLVSLWAVDSALADYSYPGDAGGGATSLNAPALQSFILTSYEGDPEYLPEGASDLTDVTRVRARIYDFSAFTLRQLSVSDFSSFPGLFPDPVLGEGGGSGVFEGGSEASTGSPATLSGTGGDILTIQGQGLGWIDSVTFIINGRQFTVTDKGLIGKQLDDGLIEDGLSPTSFRVLALNFSEQTGWSTVNPGEGNTVPATLTVTTKSGTFTTGEVLLIQGTKQDVGFLGGLLAALAGLAAALVGLLGGGGGGGGGGGPCFIATAAYGTPMAGEIDTLRAVRDTYLLNNAVGASLVDVYYQFSPYVADLVAKSPALASVVRLLLIPVVFLSKLLLAMPQAGWALLAMGFMGSVLKRKRARSKERV